MAEGSTSTHRLLRAAGAISGVAEILSLAEDEETLLQQVCRLMVEEQGYRLAWVGYARDDPDRTVEPIASAGYESGYLQSLSITWADSERGRGPTGTAIRTRMPASARRIAEDPSFGPWRAEAQRRGFASSVALPLVINDEVLGALNVYATEPEAFDPHEIALLEKLAFNLALGVTTLRLRHDQERAERASEAKSELLQAIYDASPELIFLHGEDGHLIDVNENVVNTYGWSREEILSAPPGQMMGASMDTQQAFELLSRALLGEDLDFEWTARRKDGQEFPVEVHLRALSSQGRGAARVLACVRDLTEARRAQEEQLSAEKLNSLSLLAGGVAHDFSNLLLGISLSISTALETPRDERLRTLLGYAEQACDQASRLTKQLSTYARTGSHVSELLRLEPLIRASVDFALRGSSTSAVFELPDDLWTVLGGAGQFEQVFQNLAINAAQAVEGPGSLRIVASNRLLSADDPSGLPEGRYVSVVVEDQGPGIPPELLVRVFDPYFSTKLSGTGLGLATTSAIMRRHGGRIQAGNSDGGGARFELEFPATVGSPPSEGRALPAQQRPRVKGRILVMDDQEMLRTVLASALTLGGHEVELAADGADAVQCFRAAREAGRPFDLVVLDLTVPGGMGGVEALSALQGIDPDVLAIASSGHSDSDVLSDYSAWGFAGALPKPFVVQQLLNEVERTLLATRKL